VIEIMVSDNLMFVDIVVEVVSSPRSAAPDICCTPAAHWLPWLAGSNLLLAAE